MWSYSPRRGPRPPPIGASMTRCGGGAGSRHSTSPTSQAACAPSSVQPIRGQERHGAREVATERTPALMEAPSPDRPPYRERHCTVTMSSRARREPPADRPLDHRRSSFHDVDADYRLQLTESGSCRSVTNVGKQMVLLVVDTYFCRMRSVTTTVAVRGCSPGKA